MSTLTGNKISLTYKSLIKTTDNDVLGAVLKELSDGLGNNSGVFLNTGGDLKSTGTLEFSNFKATAYAVTINKLVNEADGISNNDNDTSLPTSAAVKDYVDTHVTSQDLDFSDGTNPGAVDLDSQVFAIVGTSNEIETLASGQQLQIGLPNDVTISGTYTGTTFSGDLNGTINTATTAVTQTAGDNSTKVATTAYVDTLDAASDLDFSDGSVNSAVNLNTQVFSIQGTSNEITTTASGQSLTIALDSAGVDLPDGSTAITQTAGDNSTKVATTAYVDVLDAASDLDIAGDTGTGDVNLNTQTFTLSGTTNQIITAVSGQQATFSLPSTVHRDLQGNVTGNADTATAWQTARDLSISGEATGTLSSVDGTSNISGAVTLTNSAVTGKVLTGLPTPAASTVQPSDSILEGIGKLQSQINGIANGLQFQGTWDAATNTPTLTSGGGEVDSGTTTGQTANKLIDSSQNFLTTVSVGDKVINQVDGQSALVTNVDSNTSLSLDADIMLSGEAYTIDASPFLVQGHYYVVSVGGTTSLNGNANWTIGDWVIAGADNIWSKLDHTQIDGQGTPGNLPVWNTATTLTDSIVSESGTALTVTGSLTTTLGASVTGDFAVNTNKFTVNATSGDAVIAGNLNFPDDKRIRLGTSNAFQIYYDSAAQSGQGEATITTGFFTKIESNFFKVGSSTKTAINIDANNYVRLYHSGNQKLGTTSTGVTITGAINADSADISGNATFVGSITANTGSKITSSSADTTFSIETTSGTTIFPILDFVSSHSSAGARIRVSGTDVISLDKSQNSTFAGNVTLSQPTNGSDAILNLTSKSAAGNSRTSSIEYDADNEYMYFKNAGTTVATMTSGGNVGIGGTPSTFANYTNVTIKGGSSGSNLDFKNSSGTRVAAIVSNPSSDFGIETNEATPILFKTNDTERMRIDSSGVISIGPSTTSSEIYFNYNNTNNKGGLKIDYSTGELRLSAGESGNGYHQAFYTNGTERMRIDSSGNLLLGNGVGNPYLTFLSAGGNGGNQRARIFGYADGGTYGGGLEIQTRDSANIFQNRMRITSEGIIEAVADISVYTNTQTVFAGYGDTDSGEYGIALNTSGDGLTGSIASNLKYSNGTITQLNSARSSGEIKFSNTTTASQTAAISFGGYYKGTTTFVERMRITTDGRVGIGGSPQALLDVVKTSSTIYDPTDDLGQRSGTATIHITNQDTATNTFGQIMYDTDGSGQAVARIVFLDRGAASSGIAFVTENSETKAERMRIESTGEVLIGKTSLANNVAGVILRKSATAGGLITLTRESGTAIQTHIHFFNSTGGTVGTVQTSNSSTLYNTSSDYRLKEDLQDFNGLDKVSKIPVYDFKWKSDESRSYGVMAHELQEVLPDAVSGEKDAEEMQSVDYSKIVPLLVKSIQELKAEVDKLKQECKCK